MNPYDDRTHDISSENYHVKDIETFGETLEKVAAAAFPGHGYSRYKEVSVLLLSWEADDLGVMKEISDLRDVFSKTYHYRTEDWRIPSDMPYLALRNKINDFFINEHDADTNLWIVYYGGHGFMDKERRCVWSSTSADDSTTLAWYGLQTDLEQSRSDVLILLDCCAAASSTGGLGYGVTEVIAACGFETSAPGVEEHSFTQSLINTLADWEHRLLPLSATVLHSEILGRIKSWNPKYHGSTQHQRIEAAERRKTPIHITISNQDNERSIVLRPIKPAPGLSSEHNTNQQVCGQPNECPTVLVTLALEDDQRLATSNWARWLQSAPGLIKHGRVQGIFKGGSILILLSLPVAIWDLLPNDPAVRFIGFVTSGDLMKEEMVDHYRTLKKG